MFKSLPVILLFLTVFFSACKKDSFTSVKVTYYVKIAENNTVNISYNSDYYFDSGTRKTISYTSGGGYWVATHIARKQEDYYIRVDYVDALQPDTSFRVKVIFNDTLDKDSAVYDMVVSPVELQGTVTN